MQSTLQDDLELVRDVITNYGDISGLLERNGWPVDPKLSHGNGVNTIHRKTIGLFKNYPAPRWRTRMASTAQINLCVPLNPIDDHGELTGSVNGIIQFGYMHGYKYRQKFVKNTSVFVTALWGLWSRSSIPTERLVLEELGEVEDVLKANHDSWADLIAALTDSTWSFH